MKLIIISTSTMCVYILTTFNEHLEHCLKWIGDNFRKIKRKNTVYVKKMLTDIRAYIKERTLEANSKHLCSSHLF